MVVQVRRGGKTVRVPGTGGIVRQHIWLGVRHDSPSDALIAERKGSEVVYRQLKTMENMGGVHR